MKGLKILLAVIVVIGAISAYMYIGFQRRLAPLTVGESRMFRVAEGRPLKDVLEDLQKEGVIRDASATLSYATMKRKNVAVDKGTYEVKPGQDADQILAALRKPVRIMVRIPEGWWIARVAKRLEEKEVCSADEYIKLANSPGEFQEFVKIKLPEKSLEGYLYPDTYDLPPGTGAKDTIIKQLQTFEKKVAKDLKPDTDLNRVLTIASMVELEAATDEERPKVAGVIENRLKKGQRLELDATVLYAMQEWKNLGQGEVRKVISPYNTYLNGGLPPGPIGSPSLKSIEGALKPDSHPYFFYVARPNRTHYFSATYSEHMAAIRKARAEWKEESAKTK